MQKNYCITITPDLLRADRPQSGAAPGPPDAAEPLVGNVGFSTLWGGARQKIRD